MTTEITIAEGLSFAVLEEVPSKKHSHFRTDDVFERLYVPFSEDFGPPSTGTIYHFCTVLEKKLKKRKDNETVCFYCTTSDLRTVTNSLVLIGAYCILKLGWSSSAVQERLSCFEDFTLHYRDAADGEPSYGLDVKWCFSALEKAKSQSWIDFDHFDYEEYTHYEQVENGDFNWIIPGKLLAFCSPTERAFNNGVTASHTPAFYIDYFQRNGVSTIVRLNSSLYRAESFTARGFDHRDLQYADGTTPTTAIVEQFLSIVENAKGAVAVHCKQGLGRTGTLNGCYIMKHYDFNAAEAIAFQRIQRPGSVVGPQQQFLHKLERKLKSSKQGIPMSPTKKTGDTPVKLSPRSTCSKSARKRTENPVSIPEKSKKTPVKQTA